ncbi:serine-threonine/tyrosine-protein kinase catalytic domain-containing protein [Tanacetum coccineum]
MCKSTLGICSMLPATHVLTKDPSYKKLETLSISESRFKEALRLGTNNVYNFTCGLGSFMFSPHYSYACYLVFKFDDNHVLSDDIHLLESEYNLGETTQGTVFVHMNPSLINIPTIEPKKDIGMRDSSKSIQMEKGYMDPQNSWVRERNDGWTEFSLTEPLPQLENHESLEVKLRPKFGSLEGIVVEGIEFRPVVRDRSYLAETSTKDNLIGNQLQEINDHEENKDDDEYWEKKLPDDYQRHIEMSDKPLDYTTKKELYLLFCHGFLAANDNGQLWISVCKLTRGICSFLPATHVLSKDSSKNKLETLSLSESRFKDVRKLENYYNYYLSCGRWSLMLSPDCSYACYLVFKLEDDHVLSKDRPIFRTYYKLGVNEYRVTVTANLDLSSVITIPTLKPKKETGSSKSIQKDVGISKCYIPLDYLTKSWVEKRNDGWLEASDGELFPLSWVLELEVVEELYEESIEEDEVSLVDEVLEVALGALGDDS